MPDVLFIRKGRGHLAGEQGMAAAPDLVVEVLSPTSGRVDRAKKLGWYLQLGVPEYWIVDPALDTLDRFVLGEGGRYLMAEVLEGDAVFRPDSLDGLEIPLRELWTVPAD